MLEDLSQHFRHLHAGEAYTLTHYKLVLENLASLHAASIAWEEQEGFNIGERYNDVLNELMLSSQNEWFTTGLKVSLTSKSRIYIYIYLIKNVSKTGPCFSSCTSSEISNRDGTKVH